MNILKFEQVEDKIFRIREIPVIIDSDVAKLYGVETKRINEAVANNPDKFPDGYLIELTQYEWNTLKSKFSTLNNKGRGKHTKFIPKAFTEKGLYMIATILKSPIATQTTINIIETFAKIKKLTNNLRELSSTEDNNKKKNLLKKSGNIISELLDDDNNANETETTIELNFAVLKLKHTVKRKPKKP
jgi:hypothetical protein